MSEFFFLPVDRDALIKMTKSVQYALIALTWKCSRMVVIPSKINRDIFVYLLALFRYQIALHINLGIVMMTNLKNPLDC